MPLDNLTDLMPMLWAGAGAVALAVLVVTTMRMNAHASGHKRLRARWELEKKTFSELEKLYREALEDLKRKNGGTCVIPIVHDISFEFEKRDNQRQYLTIEEACDVIAQIQAASKTINIDVILHTLGGDALAAEMIAGALKSHKGKTTVYVPYIAMSAGTMVALAADELVIDTHATLGPIDTQYWGFPADAWEHLRQGQARENRPVRSDYTFMVSYMVEKRAKDEKRRALDLLNPKYHRNAEGILNVLMDPTHHGERITLKKAMDMGIKPSQTEVRDDIRHFLDLRIRMLEEFPKRDQGAGQQVTPKTSADLKTLGP